MEALLILLAIGMLAILGAFAVGTLFGRHLLVSKSAGEAILANTIEACLPQPHVLINNLTLPNENGSAQIDHVLITPTGIFVIETKHYQGWIFGNPNQSQWTQTIYKKKSKFPNPIRQNYGHIKALQSIFTLSEDNFIPIVVFTGEAEFKTDLGPTVITLDELIPRLTAERPAIFDERKMAYIVGRIEMKRLRRSLETDEYHLNYVRQRINERRQPMKSAR
jgi:restriction system protein